MRKVDKIERQRALIIKHELRRKGNKIEGMIIPRLQTLYRKIRKKLLQTGYVESRLCELPWFARRMAVMVDADENTCILPRRVAAMVAELGWYRNVLAVESRP